MRLTNGRWQSPAPVVSVIESDVPEGMTLREWRSTRARANRRPWWRWRQR